MAVKKFGIDQLALIDGGRIKEAWEREMKRMREDCQDRPALNKPRQVHIVTSLVPVCGEDGTLESVKVAFDIDHKMPKRQSQVYDMKAVPGGLVFNELSPEDVRQGTLDEIQFKEVSDAQ